MIESLPDIVVELAQPLNRPLVTSPAVEQQAVDLLSVRRSIPSLDLSICSLYPAFVRIDPSDLPLLPRIPRLMLQRQPVVGLGDVDRPLAPLERYRFSKRAIRQEVIVMLIGRAWRQESILKHGLRRDQVRVHPVCISMQCDTVQVVDRVEHLLEVIKRPVALSSSQRPRARIVWINRAGHNNGLWLHFLDPPARQVERLGIQLRRDVLNRSRCAPRVLPHIVLFIAYDPDMAATRVAYEIGAREGEVRVLGPYRQRPI